MQPETFVPVTLADLAREGRVVWCYCNACGHEAEPMPDALGLPMVTPVPQASCFLKCPKCGSRKVETKPQLHDRPVHVIRTEAAQRQRPAWKGA